MKTIGLIGGMSWESTVPYYRLINETIKERLGGLHSAKLILYSVDFHEIEAFQRKGDWDNAGRALANAARSLEAAGASFLVLCTNTMHKVAHHIEAAVSHQIASHRRSNGGRNQEIGAFSRSVYSARASPWNTPSTETGCWNAMVYKSKSLQLKTATSFTASSMKSCVLES